ncbi:MAG: hypothetical protein ACOYNC_17895 [Bacteroidales bacterium]
MKIEWDGNDKDLPRLIEIDDNEVLNDELTQRLEGNSHTKIKNVEWYTPKPKYLLVGVRSINTKRGFKLVLVVELTTTIVDLNLGIINIYPRLPNHEFVFDILRMEFHQYVVQKGNCLYFEEFQSYKGRNISILKILDGLCQTLTNSIESEDYLRTDLLQRKNIWEN